MKDPTVPSLSFSSFQITFRFVASSQDSDNYTNNDSCTLLKTANFPKIQRSYIRKNFREKMHL
jgi:hypothetical protein